MRVKKTKYYSGKRQGEAILFAEFFKLNLLDHYNRKKLFDVEINVRRIYVIEGIPCIDFEVSWWIDV